MERFWSKVNKQGINECWEWQSRVIPEGYGQISMGKTNKYAHRVAYELTHGEIPNGKCVRHTCDNRACVNPKHLLLGTHQDNMDDMVIRGRHVKRGNSIPEDIRQEIREYPAKLQATADYFGVSLTTVWRIRQESSITATSTD